MKHKHLLSNYSDQHKGKKVTIGDDSTFPISSCGTIVFENAEFGDVLHVPRGRPNLLSIYRITHTNKKVELWLDIWVVEDISGKFKVVASRYCDEFKCMYKLGKISLPPALESKQIQQLATINSLNKRLVLLTMHISLCTLLCDL
jgi:hypothetical protein